MMNTEFRPTANVKEIFQSQGFLLSSTNVARIAEFERLAEKLFLDKFIVSSGSAADLPEQQLAERDREELLPDGFYQKVSARITGPKLEAGFNKIQKPVMCADAGFYCPGLGGYPATNIKDYAPKGIINRSRLQALVWEANNNADNDNRAFVVEAIGARLPDGKDLLVTGEVPGFVASELSEMEGFAFDDLFIPAGELHVNFIDQKSALNKEQISSDVKNMTLTELEFRYSNQPGAVKDWVSARAVAFAKFGKEAGLELSEMGETLLSNYSASVWVSENLV